jgi:ribonuclease HI
MGGSIEHITLNCAKTAEPQEWEVEIAQAAAAMEQPHMWFTDGSGLENGHRGGAAWCPTTRTTTKQYLGRLATVHDGELAGIDGALQNSPNANVLLLTDSEAAILTTLNLARGAAPRSGIELSIMERLAARKRQGKQTKIAWVKAHAGLPGNEEADRLAKSAAALRLQRNGLELVTHAGLREVITAARKKARAVPGFGMGRRCQGKWGRDAVTAYTQLRTNAGPFRAFLASDKGGRKVDSAICRLCKARAAETGEHIVFDCNDIYRRRLRRRFIAEARTWTDLDKPRPRPKEGVGGEQAEADTVESFFAAILRRPDEKDEEGGDGRHGEAETEAETEAGTEAETEAESEAGDEVTEGGRAQGELGRVGG